VIQEPPPKFFVGDAGGLPTASLPVDIKRNLEAIVTTSPELNDAIEEYKKVCIQLRKCLAERNFGSVRGVVDALKDQVSRVTIDADKMILHTCPVLDFLHFLLKDAVISLL
jgi:hypothetical protein